VAAIVFFILIFRICIIFIRAEKALYVLIADYNLHHYTIEYNNNMSNFELEKNINNTDKIVYNYPRVSINRNEITSTKKHLNMTFYNSSQDPNIIYTKGGDNIVYNHTKAYFSPLIHNNIADLTTGAGAAPSSYRELVIEHINQSSGNKLYLCILLQSSTSTDTNAMDTMIQFKPVEVAGQTAVMEKIELNSVIPPQAKGIIYDSTIGRITSTVIVFTTPIRINNTSWTRISRLPTLSPTLINKYHAAYTVLPRTAISKPDADKIYISCNPTGESEETLRTYNVPINSDTGTAEDAKTAMYTTSAFAVIAIMTAILVLFLPGAYLKIVIEPLTAVGEEKKVDVDKMRSIDFWIIIIVLAEIGTCFGVAFNQMTTQGENTSQTMTIFIAIMLIVALFESICILYVKKGDNSYVPAISYVNKDNWVESISSIFKVFTRPVVQILIALATIITLIFTKKYGSIITIPVGGLLVAIAPYLPEKTN